MKKTTIQPVTKSKIIDYSNQPVQHVWLKLSHDHHTSESNNKNDLIQLLQTQQKSCICIQSETIDDSDIIKAIFDSARHNRIYVMTNDKPSACKDIVGACLIRYGINNIGSFILVNPNSSNAHGLLYSADLTQTSFTIKDSILLELDTEQIQILFRFFCNNFWNKCTQELIDNFSKPRETEDPPLDFFPNRDDFCDSNYVVQQLRIQDSNAILSIPAIKPDMLCQINNTQRHDIYCNLENNDHELLCQLSNNNSAIYASKTFNVSYFFLSSGKNWLIPKTTVVNKDQLFALPLNEKQSYQLEKLFYIQQESADYEFLSHRNRSDLIDQTIRRLDGHERSIKKSTSKPLSSIQCSQLLEKTVFESQEPNFEDDDISCEIKYTWKILPFVLPKNAKQAKLYNDWQQFENYYNNVCQEINALITTNENRTVVEKLKRFFLGKKHSLSLMRKELEELQDKKLSEIETGQCKQILSNVNQLRNQLDSNIKEIENTIKQNQIDEEIERLTRKKQEKEADLKAFIEKQEKLLKEKDIEKQESLEKFLNEKDLESFIKKHELSHNLSHLKNQLKSFSKKKYRKKNPEDSTIAQKIMEEIQEIERPDFRKQFEEDKLKFNKEIKTVEREIAEQQKQKNKIGHTDNENKSTSSLTELIGSKKQPVKKHNNSLELPNNLLQLPKVGELYELGKQTFLVIEFWEDYDMGIKEMKRFNATLCAKP